MLARIQLVLRAVVQWSSVFPCIVQRLKLLTFSDFPRCSASSVFATPPPCTHAYSPMLRVVSAAASPHPASAPLHPIGAIFPQPSLPTLPSHGSFCSLSSLGPSRNQLSPSTTSKERSSISHPNRNKRHSIDLPDIREM